MVKIIRFQKVEIIYEMLESVPILSDIFDERLENRSRRRKRLNLLGYHSDSANAFDEVQFLRNSLQYLRPEFDKLRPIQRTEWN